MIRQARVFVLALLILAAASLWPAPSRAIEYKDILGSWCSKTAQLTFTRDSMRVKWFDDNQMAHYQVTKFKFESTTVQIYWVDMDKNEVSAVYGEFSADNQQMYLQKNENAPRREYRRCQ